MSVFLQDSAGALDFTNPISCSIVLLFSWRNQLERLILQTLCSMFRGPRCLVFLEESAGTPDFTKPTVVQLYYCFPKGISWNAWFYKPYVQFLEGPDVCFPSGVSWNAWFYEPYQLFNCIIVFLEESVGTLDFTSPMFNAQKKQLSSQGRHRGFKHIEVNRKSCKKETRYTYGVPRFE